MKPLLDIKAIEGELCRRSFSKFVQLAWPQIDPAPLVWGWHMDAICKHLQAVTDGRIRKLIINIPPGHAKSMLVSVLWPAWVWAVNPKWRALFASYALDLVTRDAVKSRDLMRSEWYQSRFPDTVKFQGDQDQKTFFGNTAGGFRVALSVGGKATGFRGDTIVVDDPLKADDAHSAIARQTAIRWKTETMASRVNDPETASEVLIMQRLHQDDLTGYLLKAGGWQHLCLPSEFEPGRRSVTYDVDGNEFWRDPRSDEGDLLFEQKYTKNALSDMKRAMGSFAYSGQHQQSPTPLGGGLLKREWFNYRYLRPGETAIEGLNCVPLPKRFDRIVIAADCTFKKTDDSDRVAIGVWGKLGPDAFLLDLRWDRMGFVDTVQAINDLKAKWPQTQRVLIEDKANGSAVIEVLRKKVSGIIAVEPEGGKESRIAATTGFFEAGNVRLPCTAPWVADYIEEACGFPAASHDDAIDMSAYALMNLLSSGSLARLEALGRW